MTTFVILTFAVFGVALTFVVAWLILGTLSTDRCDPDVLDEWWGNDVTTVELPTYVTGWSLNGRQPPVPTRRSKRRWALHGRYTAVVALYDGRHRKGSAKGTSAQRHPVCARMQRSVQACWNAAPKVIWRFPSWEYPTTELHFSLLALLDEEGALV